MGKSRPVLFRFPGRREKGSVRSPWLPFPSFTGETPPPTWRPARTPPPPPGSLELAASGASPAHRPAKPPPRAGTHITRLRRRQGGEAHAPAEGPPPPRSSEGAGRRGAWRARGPTLPLAAGPCGGPRAGPGLERGRRWQRGDGGGGSAWEQAAYARRGALPLTAGGAAGRAAGRRFTLTTRLLTGKRSRRVGSVLAQARGLEGCGALGPSKPEALRSVAHGHRESQRPAVGAHRPR